MKKKKMNKLYYFRYKTHTMDIHYYILCQLFCCLHCLSQEPMPDYNNM